MDGQLAVAKYPDRVEHFTWDGLALVEWNNVKYINEPYVTGGNPVLANNDVMFNDMLGSTLAINDKAVGMTSFGESENVSAFFTGKPHVEELGYAFLFRNYRSDYGKWQTADPLGYPDGWNNFVYCNNGVVGFIDYLGGWTQGVDYSILDENVPMGFDKMRTPENDKFWANTADWVFGFKNAPLSKALVQYAIAQTGNVVDNYIVPKQYYSAIENDSGFVPVRQKVKSMMQGIGANQTVYFNNVSVSTQLTSHDLATSIHGVIFILNGEIVTDSSFF